MRKPPIQHTVKKHAKKGKIINSYSRGKGQHPKLAKPFLKRKTLTDTRLESKIEHLEDMLRLCQDRDDEKMKKFYQKQIDILSSLLGKTKSQIKDKILLIGDELESLKMGPYDFNNTYNLETAFELAQKITGVKYPTPEYYLATGSEQDAFLIGYHPKAEKQVWMSPNQFLSLATPTEYSPDALEDIRQKIKSGQPMDTLWFDVDVNTNQVISHEGRHRAKVAKELGIKKIPVLLYAKDGYSWDEAQNLPDVNDIIKERSRR